MCKQQFFNVVIMKLTYQYPVSPETNNFLKFLQKSHAELELCADFVKI